MHPVWLFQTRVPKLVFLQLLLMLPWRSFALVLFITPGLLFSICWLDKMHMFGTPKNLVFEFTASSLKVCNLTTHRILNCERSSVQHLFVWICYPISQVCESNKQHCFSGNALQDEVWISRFDREKVIQSCPKCGSLVWTKLFLMLFGCFCKSGATYVISFLLQICRDHHWYRWCWPCEMA